MRRNGLFAPISGMAALSENGQFFSLTHKAPLLLDSLYPVTNSNPRRIHETT